MPLVIFQLLVLLFSAIMHEIAHGLAAEHLGDPTARHMGRLTLNPIRHLDPFGSLILPLGLFFLSGGAFVFGWAKPVPYNPAFLRKPERDAGLIALAGPASNIALAAVVAGLYRAALYFGLIASIPPLAAFLQIIVLINISLAIFNLVPIPPLDGSKVLFALVPGLSWKVKAAFEQYGFLLLVIFIAFGFRLIAPIIFFLFRLLTGA